MRSISPPPTPPIPINKPPHYEFRFLKAVYIQHPLPTPPKHLLMKLFLNQMCLLPKFKNLTTITLKLENAGIEQLSIQTHGDSRPQETELPFSPLRSHPAPSSVQVPARACGDITVHLPHVRGTRTRSTVTSSPTGAGPQPTSASPEAKELQRCRPGAGSPALEQEGQGGRAPAGATARGDPHPGPDFLTGRRSAASSRPIRSLRGSSPDLDPAPARRSARPPWPAGALSAGPACGRRPAREEVRAADSGPRRACSAARPGPAGAPPPPPAPRPGSAGERREGAGNGHGGRRGTPTALPQRHATRPRPTCAPAPARAWPGAAHPDAAAAAGGLARSPPLRRTERPARRGEAQRSPRILFVWLKRRDVTRRPNRRLAEGGAAGPGDRSAPCRALCGTSAGGA